MTSRLIWYRLVDSVDGQSYKGATVSSVSLPSDKVIDEFRDAVQAKWDKPGYLKDIPAGALTVYKNKEFFDKRNNIKDKEEPLKSSVLLNALGTTEDDALVVVVPSVSTSEANEPITKKRRFNEEKNFIHDLTLKMPAPSSFAHYRDKGSWVEFLQQNPNEIICHRDLSEEHCAPVSLLNPIFNSFIHDLKHIHISSEDCQFVGELTESMCGSFTSEQKRVDMFIALFEEYTKLRLGPVTRGSSTTDGSLMYDNGALYCNLEVKIEKGCGHGDPYMQSIAYYIKNLPTAAKHIQYPCFLLELCGTAFSVNGIINTDRLVICDPLSPTFQLFCNQEFAMMEQITKLFASLRKNLMTLRSQGFHGQLSQSSSFPFLSSFFDRDVGTEFKIQYRQRIKGLLFSAKIIGHDEDVIVKFSSRYNPDVHIHCHSCGFAPRLISYSTLGNYCVVVMEKLDLRSLTTSDLLKSEIQQQIKIMATQLKNKTYVHGDLRDCNIHLDIVNNKVVLVDFDWAGFHGIDVYPPFMNPAIEWPVGACTGKTMRHEHDEYWLQRLY